MARLQRTIDSDDDLPDLDDVLNNYSSKLSAPTTKPQRVPKLRTSLRKRETSPEKPRRNAAQSKTGELSTGLFEAPCLKPSVPKSKPISTFEDSVKGATSRLRLASEHRSTLSIKIPSPSKHKAAPSRLARRHVDYGGSEENDSADFSVHSDFEESIWCGSATSDADSDVKLPLIPRSLSPRKLQLRKQRVLDSDESDLDTFAKLAIPAKELMIPNLNYSSSDGGPLLSPHRTKQIMDFSSSDKENDGPAMLKFTPPRLHKIPPVTDLTRPITPPASPSKSKLVSPSKNRFRIPTPPGRASIDAFWDAENVNQWNDQYSPQKPIISPRKNRFQPDSSASPSTSPKKASSPTKRTRAELDARKDFETRKHQLAETFLHELDEKITSGEINSLSSTTGGVKLIWSKTLNSTAGRANWKRETCKSRQLDGTTSLNVKHHASIELAEKVIDDEIRLVNVIAHEFCHLANFMISGIKNQPHGRQFKIWGGRVTEAFRERGIEVTTKHNYVIDYKYVWQCENELCGQEFKRHSKSIDTARFRCGACKGKLMQVKPVPRCAVKAAGGIDDVGTAGKAKSITGYAAFVKEHFANVKREMGKGASHKEVMEALGRKYREMKSDVAEDGKAKEKTKGAGDVNSLAQALEVVVLDD